jgi:sugar phosphate isomerase/epimerase
MKYAVCNELFTTWSLQDACALTAQYGFQGIEIAPFTLAEDPRTLNSSKTREIKTIIQDAGLQCVGLHWLLKAPQGLHLTTPDVVTRQHSWEVFKYLIEFCHHLEGTLMVLGSGKQRNALTMSSEHALTLLKEGLQQLAPFAETAGVKILVEALSSQMTNVINTLQEAREFVSAIGSPAISSMFDFHNCDDEQEPWHQLIHEYFDIIQHVHLNEVDGNYPGTGTSDFVPAFKALTQRNYRGWVSLEIFQFDTPPAQILSTTIQTLTELENQVHA